MNNNIVLLDCTLREAPIENLLWGKYSIRKMIKGLASANIDIIECGFLKDEGSLLENSIFKDTDQIREVIGTRVPNIEYVALVDYGRYDLKNLKPYDGTSIDAIRVCFKKNESNQVLEYAEKIRDKGYKVCIQHVDTMGYTDKEILDFIDKINKFAPYAYSIVDTFGAMYKDDLLHFLDLVNSSLRKDIILGFHSHNNLMLANANVQEFISCLGSKRKIIVDSSLLGCGRGAGNAHTELIAEYLNRKQDANYDVDILMDLIDTVVTNAKEKATWGYSIPYFISGMYNAHPFNVQYLSRRHNISSRDLRGIIEKLNNKEKKMYNYDYLEKLYLEYFDNHIDDHNNVNDLKDALRGRNILLLAPGKSIVEERQIINDFIQQKDPIIIGINNYIEGYKQDYIFYSSVRRYESFQYQSNREKGPQIIKTSNISYSLYDEEIIFDFSSLIKVGWSSFDSSVILLLRLLIKCNICDINIAGLDGYSGRGHAFYDDELETNLVDRDRKIITEDNLSMLKDLCCLNPHMKINFVTSSYYDIINNV